MSGPGAVPPGIARRLARWSAVAAAMVIILLALAVSVARLAIPHAPEYRGEAVRWASVALGAPVEIAALDIRWRTLRPEVILTEVRFVSADATRAFAAPEVRVGLSVWALVRYGRLVPARITVHSPDVIVDVGRGDAEAADRWRRLFEQRDRRGTVIVEDGRFELLMDSGRRRVELEGVSGRVGSDGMNHRIDASARVVGSAQGSITLHMDARGWPGEPDLAGDAHLDASGIEFAALQDFGRERLEGGTLDLGLELEVRGGAAQRLSVDFGMSQVRGAPSGANGDFRIRRAAGDIEWVRRDGGWDVELRNLAVGRESGTSESGSLAVGFTAPQGPDAFAHWRATADRVVLEDIALLARLVPWGVTDRYRPWLERSPAGIIDDGEFSARHRPGSSARWKARVVANSLSLAGDPASAVPGFAGLGTMFTADQDGGRAELVSDGAVIAFPELFRDRLGLGRSVLEAQWTQNDGAWSVALPRIELENGDIALSGRGSIMIPDGDDPSMRLEVDFRDAVLPAKSPYLPVGIMQPGLVEWLDRAVVGGEAPSGRFTYDGALRAGALRDGGAVMEVEFSATDITLDFADGWPSFTGGDAQVRFTATGFDAQVHRGSLGAAPITGARVGIADFDDALLSIDGTAGDRLADSLAAFRETPVGRQPWLSDLEVDGHAVVELEVSIPLRSVGDTHVSGSVGLQGATLGFRGMPGPLSATRGQVRIDGDRVTANAIEARFLDRPLSVGVTTGENEGGERGVAITFAGSSSAEALAGILDRTQLPITGTFGWTALLTAPYDDTAPPVLWVESGLVGLAIDLPDPLGKPADAARGVMAELVLSSTRRILSIDGGPAGRFDAELETTDEGWRIARGRVHLGGGEAPGLPDRDLALTGRLAEWRHGGGLEPARHGVTAIDLVIDELTAFRRGLGEVRVRGARADGIWAWRFDGTRITGDVEVPDEPTAERPIRADLVRLEIPVPDQAAPAPVSEPDARSVAPVSFHVGDFTLGIVDLGEINGIVRRVENGVAMDGFTATRRDMRITADASWHTVDGHHRTVLRGTLDSTDVRSTLAALGYRGSIDAAAGHLQVDLNWLGSPLQDPLGILDGTASVRLERGQLSDVQAGAGRVFGLLSVNALPRRLALDFSDVFGRGLAFDSIQGEFRIDGGDAFTDELVMQGPAARITIAGRTGLAARDYDQEVEVIGTFRTSLALAGTLAGGPGVGAALLIASEILKRPLEDLARVRYRLTGPWDDPEFERLHEGRGEPR